MNPIASNSVYHCKDPLSVYRANTFKEALRLELYTAIRCQGRGPFQSGAHLSTVIKSLSANYRRCDVMAGLLDLESQGLIEYRVPAESATGARVFLTETNPFNA